MVTSKQVQTLVDYSVTFCQKTKKPELSQVWKASREEGILPLWEKGNDKPIMTAIADHNNKTWNDTGESQLTPEIVAQFREHLSPVLEEARALREQKRKQKQKRQLQKQRRLGEAHRPIGRSQKRKQKQGGLEL
ncbi:MAG: hypothetical protein F6K45_24055 [Kamptonema sp. SIO1D9]|nr:hypothetical protein [Kamptonema sp. SIO1D9]